MYGNNNWPPSHDESDWDELHYYDDILARWNCECQTELERWQLFLESKYQDQLDSSKFELIEEQEK